jgi:hypothetical protein
MEKAFGTGRVVVALRSLHAPTMRDRPSTHLVEFVEAKARRAARCASNQFEMTIHETPDGKQYLVVINSNVEKSITDSMPLAGEFKAGLDLDVPNGFPVAFKTGRGETSFALRLEPGEFVLLELLR